MILEIETTMQSLYLDPEELREIDTAESYILYRNGSPEFVSWAEYQEAKCPKVDRRSTKVRMPSELRRDTSEYIVLTMKNGEQWLIGTGSDPFLNVDRAKALRKAILEQVSRGKPMGRIRVDNLVRSEEPHYASRILSGEEAEIRLRSAGKPRNPGKLSHAALFGSVRDGKPVLTDVVRRVMEEMERQSGPEGDCAEKHR